MPSSNYGPVRVTTRGRRIDLEVPLRDDDETPLSFTFAQARDLVAHIEARMSEYKPVTAADHLGRFGAGLVGEGCPWATVQQMADDLEEAVRSSDFYEEDGGGNCRGYDGEPYRSRLSAAIALLSTGSNP